MNERRNENLIPFKKGDPKIAELARKGVQIREAKRAERKKMQLTLQSILKMSLKKGDSVTVDDILDMEEAKKSNVSVQEAILIVMAQRAMQGDVQAAIFLRDTAGDKPTDKVELDSNLTIESWAKNHKIKL